MPCNNDLLAGNFVDDGERMWLIDYEYSGNNDACFELGNTATECDFDDDQVEALVAAYFGEVRPDLLARVRLQSLVSEYGWSLWGAIQAAASTLDFDFDAWGQERFDKAAATFRAAALRDGCWTDGDRWLTCPSRARVVIIGGGVIGTSVAYHLTELGWTDVLLLEQGSLSGGTTWHAAGLVGPLRASESGTRLVQYSAELYARLEEETGQATGYRQVRRRDRGPHRGPDGPAAADRGQRGGVRHGVRAAHPRRGAREVAGDGRRRPPRRALAAR